MEATWAGKALSDLTRLYEFLAPVNKPVAARTVQTLTAAIRSLVAHPRIGERLEEFAPSEIRRLVVGHYEVRYEIQDAVRDCIQRSFRTELTASIHPARTALAATETAFHRSGLHCMPPGPD